MRSFRVHACAAEANGRIPYVVLSLCGRHRVSIDMAGLQTQAAKPGDAAALSLDALYDLLQGKRLTLDRVDGAISLSPSGRWLLIQKDGSAKSHKIWMAELALAWNMLAGYDGTPTQARWDNL